MSNQPGTSLRLAERTAEAIANDLDACRDPCLPAIQELCPRYGVSRPTMVDALGLLRGQGLLTFRRGSRIRIAGRPQPSPRPRATSAASLFARLRDQIASARLKTGQEMPKCAFLASRERVSVHTVLAAYDLLVKANLSHRVGRRMIVGPSRPSPSASAGMAEPPVILAFVRNSNAWPSLCSSTRTHQFGQAFVEYANRHGFRLDCAFPGNAPQTYETNWPAGKTRIARAIHRMGSRYLGTLMAGTATDLAPAGEWAAWFLRFRRPVVWLDAGDASPALVPASELFARCHASEERATRAAVEMLARHGHRQLAYPHHPRQPWQVRRLRLLREAARAQGALKVIGFHDAVDLDWTNPDSPDLVRRLRRLRDSRIPGMREAFERLVSRTPATDRAPSHTKMAPFIRLTRAYFEGSAEMSLDDRFDAEYIWTGLMLAPALLEHGATAIVSPNDRYAHVHWRWLRRAGVVVPDRVSLIAFDNEYTITRYPITSVDFGFGDLGYKAFHAILNDLPVKRDRNGAIPSEPFVTDRGSVARARQPATGPHGHPRWVPG